MNSNDSHANFPDSSKKLMETMPEHAQKELLTGLTSGTEPPRRPRVRKLRACRRVFSSDGTSLVFPSGSLYQEYEAARRALDLEFYRRIRAEYGIFASNQDGFVDSVDQLNDWDGRTMENWLAAADARRAAEVHRSPADGKTGERGASENDAAASVGNRVCIRIDCVVDDDGLLVVLAPEGMGEREAERLVFAAARESSQSDLADLSAQLVERGFLVFDKVVTLAV